MRVGAKDAFRAAVRPHRKEVDIAVHFAEIPRCHRANERAFIGVGSALQVSSAGVTRETVRHRAMPSLPSVHTIAA